MRAKKRAARSLKNCASFELRDNLMQNAFCLKFEPLAKIRTPKMLIFIRLNLELNLFLIKA